MSEEEKKVQQTRNTLFRTPTRLRVQEYVELAAKDKERYEKELAEEKVRHISSALASPVLTPL